MARVVGQHGGAGADLDAVALAQHLDLQPLGGAAVRPGEARCLAERPAGLGQLLACGSAGLGRVGGGLGGRARVQARGAGGVTAARTLGAACGEAEEGGQKRRRGESATARTGAAQWNESPQAQDPPAFGLSIVKPCWEIVSA
ncbi:hypothetical protein GCM10027067_11460 [Pseudactinotalea suaedae]